MREDKILQKREKMLKDQEVSMDTVHDIMFQNIIEKYGVMAVKDRSRKRDKVDKTWRA